MSTVDYSTEKEWVDNYQTIVQHKLLYDDLSRQALRAELRQYAQETIDASILELRETKLYKLTIAAGAMISSVPFPGSHILSKKLCTDSAVVAYSGKLLTLLGLADASAVGKLFKEALDVTNRLPESSSWFAIVAKESRDYLNDKEADELKKQLKNYWNEENMTEVVNAETERILGTTAADEARDLIHHMHLFGPIIKGYRGGKNARKRLDLAATFVREKALTTHQKVFVEVAIDRAL